MIERDAVKAILVNAPELARMSGLSIHTIRSILAGRRGGHPETRAKLAAALRAHSTTLAALADQLDAS